MKIPIFEEILLNQVTAEKLKIIVSESRIGKVPTFINLTELKKIELDHMILSLEQIILEHNIHPAFPYPLYIISDLTVNSIFPIVKSIKDLPDHYFKKIKRPNNKELQLLNKLSLKVDKIRNLELYKVLLSFKNTAPSQKKLYKATKELYFLETLFSKLETKTKKNS